VRLHGGRKLWIDCTHAFEIAFGAGSNVGIVFYIKRLEIFEPQVCAR
jgi:hypothetical protein